MNSAQVSSAQESEISLPDGSQVQLIKNLQSNNSTGLKIRFMV
jgi:hypothetical protein